MPKQARNTKRGSRVVHAKQLVQRQLEAALAQHAAAPALPLTELARRHGVSYHMLWRAWKKYATALAAGDADAMSDAAVSHRGGHNRTFTPLQESVLRDCVLAAAPAMGHQQIREAALQLAADVGVAGFRHGLRHRRAFTASDGFVSAFKQRNRLSSHRCALLRVSDREHAARDIDAECLDYVLTVQGAVDAYGAALVLNMDETPSQMCDMPVTAVVRTGVKEPARIKTSLPHQAQHHHLSLHQCRGQQAAAVRHRHGEDGSQLSQDHGGGVCRSARRAPVQVREGLDDDRHHGAVAAQCGASLHWRCSGRSAVGSLRVEIMQAIDMHGRLRRILSATLACAPVLESVLQPTWLVCLTALRCATRQVMSSNAYGGDDKVGGHGAAGAAAVGALHAAQAPRLRSAAGGYAAWKPDMDVYLERVGADGVHKRAMTDESWRKLALQVQSWSDEALAQALASIGVEDAATTASGAAGGATAATGSSTKSAEPTSEQKEQRRLVTALVERSRRTFGVIWAALPEELRVQAAHVPQGFAAGLWLWLQQKFQNTEQDSVGELLAQWVALRQEEDESFDAYRARVNQIKALLEHAKEPQSARMYVFTLLDKLQPRYKQAVLALKASGQLKEAEKIGWDNVAAFINQHERSEQRFGADSASDSAAMAAAARGGSNSGRAPAGAGYVQVGHRGGYGSRRGRGGNRHYDGARDPRVCFRCSQKGHIAENCPHPAKAGPQQRAGGPTSEPGEKASAATQLAAQTNRYGALSSDDEDVAEDNHNERSCMTYADVAAGKATAKANLPTSDRKKTPDRQPSLEKEASSSSSSPPLQQKMKTTNATPAVTISLDLALADDAWGWDTMASSCCSGNRERFAELHKRAAVSVKLADGSIVSVTHAGSVPLRMATQSGRVVRVELHDVLYHERFASNLLSGELLTKKLGWQFHSTPTETYAVTPGGSRVNLSARGRVAVLMSAGSERACRALTAGTGSVHDDATDQLVLLHERLCHMGWTRMMNLLHGGKVTDHGIDVAALSTSSLSSAEKRVRECVACIKGRATRTAFGHRGLDRGTRPGECLHMDTYSVKVEREGRLVQEYGLVVKDMYSGYSWHDRFVSKDEVADGIIKLILRTETQFGCRVKRIYSDGGTEFINQKLKAFCDRSGKEWHPTPARTQQLNGAAERTVRTFKDYERSMTQHAGGTVKLWGRAAAHAAFVWNRTHISADTGVTPYEAMRGKKPSLKHLRAVWGCDAYCHVPKEQRSALSAKAEPCIYLGHSEVQNAAVVLLLSTKKVICSRDVTYRSSSFGFMRALQLGDASVRDALQLQDAHLNEEADLAVGGQQMEPATSQGGCRLLLQPHEAQQTTNRQQQPTPSLKSGRWRAS